MQSFRKQAQRHSARLIAAVDKVRTEERLQYGETVYLLEPNVKRSRGALRDIQLLRWVGFARHGETEPETLLERQALPAEDVATLQRAREHLLRLRNEMHFFARKSNDVLDRAEQVRLAEAFGYQGEAGLLPVEQFMREYFRQTEGISQVVTRFLANSRRGPRWGELLAPLFSHEFERDFRVAPTQISRIRAGWPSSAAIRPKSCDWPNWPACTTSRLRGRRPKRFGLPCRTCPRKSRPNRPGDSSPCCRSRPAWANCCAACTRCECWKSSFRPSATRAVCCSSTSITSTPSTNIRCAPSSRRPIWPATRGR